VRTKKTEKKSAAAGIFSDSSGFLLKAKKASAKSFSEYSGCMN
jgi:hypothetical protein